MPSPAAERERSSRRRSQQARNSDSNANTPTSPPPPYPGRRGSTPNSQNTTPVRATRTPGPSVRADGQQNTPGSARSDPPTSTTRVRHASGDSAVDFVTLLRNSSVSTTPRAGSILRTRLVIGIDFGTTFSGVAYAVVPPNANPENVRINTIRNWPGRGPNGNRALANKVPTIIAFDEADGDRAYWGYDIPQRLRAQSIKYVKLLLEPDVAREVSSLGSIIDPEATGVLLASKSKNAVEVASVYVKSMWDHAKAYIIQQMGQARFNFADKVILFTVPAVWSERAKHNTYMLAVGAGLASPEYQLHMVSEPEAAAIAVLNDPIRVAQLAENDVYLVVDAGGGTVDLTSYQVTSTRPLKLKEVAAGDGDVCGATFLDVNFRELLRTYFGTDTMNNLDSLSEERIMSDWENSIRAPFTGNDDGWRYALVTPGIPPSASTRIIDGMIQFTADEIRPVFTPVVDKVKLLVQKQVDALRRRELQPKAIVLVGGLGCSGYLASQLRDSYEETTNSIRGSGIEILQPDLALESVAQGAVKCDILGLGSIVSLRLARYNLGTTSQREWDPEYHLPQQKFMCKYTGYHRAKNAISWHLRRNDELKANQTIKVERCGIMWEDELDALMQLPQEERTTPFEFDILASLDDERLEHATPSTRKFAKVQVPWDLTKVPKESVELRWSRDSRAYRIVNFTLEIVQSMAGMRFNLYTEGELDGEIADVNFVSVPEAMDNARIDDIADGDTRHERRRHGRGNR